MTSAAQQVKKILALSGCTRAQAAAALGIAEGSLNNKLTNDRFTVLELKTLAELCGAYIRISGEGWSMDLTSAGVESREE